MLRPGPQGVRDVQGESAADGRRLHPVVDHQGSGLHAGPGAGPGRALLPAAAGHR